MLCSLSCADLVLIKAQNAVNPYGLTSILTKSKGNICHDKPWFGLLPLPYDKYDLFIGMDSANIRNMTRILGGDKDNKIHKLMEYTGSSADVSDPWYTRDFDRCYKDIYAGCEALLNSLI